MAGVPADWQPQCRPARLHLAAADSNSGRHAAHWKRDMQTAMAVLRAWPGSSLSPGSVYTKTLVTHVQA